MSAIHKLFNRNLLTRFVAGLGAVPSAFATHAKSASPPSIHPSWTISAPKARSDL